MIFLLTGGIAAAVNFGSRIVYSNWLGFSTAVVLAYITGMITAFVLAACLCSGQHAVMRRSSSFSPGERGGGADLGGQRCCCA